MKDNKKYLDKVLEHLVRSTNIDYDKGEISFLFSLSIISFSSLNRFFVFFGSFSDYCKNMFGLTKEESKYVFKQYKEIIKDKIENER
jgi:hypothetical protein